MAKIGSAKKITPSLLRRVALLSFEFSIGHAAVRTGYSIATGANHLTSPNVRNARGDVPGATRRVIRPHSCGCFRGWTSGSPRSRGASHVRRTREELAELDAPQWVRWLFDWLTSIHSPKNSKTMPPSSRQLRMRNIRWGLFWGIGVAAVFCTFVALEAALRGSADFEREGLSLSQVIGLYLLCGLVVGVVLGVLRPWTSTPFGAIVVGFAAAFPAAVAIYSASHGNPMRWDDREWQNALLISLLIGPTFGLMRWRRTHPGSRTP